MVRRGAGLLGEGGRRAEKAWLRMSDQLYRQACHHVFEPALGDEALTEARLRKKALEAQAQPPRDHDGLGPLGKGDIAVLSVGVTVTF